MLFLECSTTLVISSNVSKIAVIATKCVAYCCIIFDVNKYDAINFLENSVFDDLGHTKKTGLNRGC